MQNSSMVAKSNALIEASYRLTVVEQRILLACLSQIGRDEVITAQVMYSVSASAIAKLAGVPENSAYRELAEAASRLKRRDVWIREKPNGEGLHDEPLQSGWVQTVKYVKREGRVELRFNQDILPYINQLSEQFTKYALGDVARMSSTHAIRLYELLVQWRARGWRKVSIDWLRESLLLGDQYPVFSDLRKWVIEPSVEQIEKHSPLWVKWEKVKTGRKVTDIMFTFGAKEPAQLSLPGTKVAGKPPVPGKQKGAMYGIPKAAIEAGAKPGESYDDAAYRLMQEKKAAQAAKK